MEFLGQSQNAATPVVGDIWGAGRIRLFISHKSENSEMAKNMKDELLKYDIASFVAHEDVAPTEEWQNVIQFALSSMDILAVLLTEEASSSHWIDQEIGCALGSNKPIIPIRLGIDPFGFISRIQALGGQGKSNCQIAEEIFELTLTKERLGLIEQAKDAFIGAVRNAHSFSAAARLGELLPRIDALTPDQVENLVNAFNDNYQAYQSFGFRDYFLPNLNRLSNFGVTYRYDVDHKIVFDGYANGYGYGGGYGIVQPTSDYGPPW